MQGRLPRRRRISARSGATAFPGGQAQPQKRRGNAGAGFVQAQADRLGKCLLPARQELTRLGQKTVTYRLHPTGFPLVIAKSAFGERRLFRLQHRFQQVGKDAFLPGQDVHLGHHAGNDRQLVAET